MDVIITAPSSAFRGYGAPVHFSPTGTLTSVGKSAAGKIAAQGAIFAYSIHLICSTSMIMTQYPQLHRDDEFDIRYPVGPTHLPRSSSL